MSDRETYSLTAKLVARSDTATLLRIVSILQSRGTQVREFSFDNNDPAGAMVTARVTSGNAGHVTLRESLRRVMEIVAVNTEVEDPRRDESPGTAHPFFVPGLSPPRGL